MTLDDSLRALATPALPRDLTRDVLSRIDQLERRRSTANTAQQKQPVTSARTAWMTAVLSASLAAVALGVSMTAGQVPLFSMSGMTRFAGLLSEPAKTAGLPTLVIGLAFYAVGLFSSLRPDRRTVGAL